MLWTPKDGEPQNTDIPLISHKPDPLDLKLQVLKQVITLGGRSEEKILSLSPLNNYILVLLSV